jgi:hopene-associated glycosyltransferase HpnB
VIAGLSLAIWVYLLLFRRMFWRVAPLLRKPMRSATPARVAVVIPARDEEDVIGQAVTSLPGQQVFVVNDNSSDRTALVAAEAGATVIEAGRLPAGWTGKMWALAQGVNAAALTNPDYFLFTDADIVHAPDSVASLVARDVALASVMVKLRCESLAERLLIPAFVFFFFKLYPPGSSTSGAAGGCILIRADVLHKLGGVEAIKGELIDDCALAAAARKHGAVWLGLTEDTRSIRAYGSFGAIWNMIARTAFTQLRHSPTLLTGTAAGMFVTYVAPPLFALQGSWIAAAAWLAMCIAYLPMLRFYRQPWYMAPLLPAVALFYLGATFHSAIRYWQGAGGEWKGRIQDQRQ